MKRMVILLSVVILIASLSSCFGANSNKTQAEADKTIDIDLTNMSGTMVYSKVYDMVTNKADYEGKIIKINGSFAVYQGGEYRDHYFACVISDATACCNQGLEFTLKNDAVYPDDYPSEGSEVTVTGTFTIYTEGENEYIELRDSTIDF